MTNPLFSRSSPELPAGYVRDREGRILPPERGSETRSNAPGPLPFAPASAAEGSPFTAGHRPAPDWENSPNILLRIFQLGGGIRLKPC